MRSSIRDLVETSAYFWGLSYKHSDDDGEAWERFASSAGDLVGASAAAVAQAFWLARWRTQGFPRVVVGPRRTASLMATGIASEQMLELAPPWRAFLVELTDSPLVISTPEGPSPIDRIEVHYATHRENRPAWWMLAESVAGPSLHRFGEPPERWLQDNLDPEPVEDGFSVAPDDSDLRALTCLSRLVAGLCFSLSLPEQRAAAARRAKGKSYKARRRGPPNLQDFVLGDDVRVDVREAVSAYVERGGRAPKVQSLVRGHWRRQPHGPDRQQRKWIHVEPYWRGPEDAPVLVRRHRITEAK